ncbi:tRNA lysidine(34) synthetase TilS [Salinimonas chungwhensis]|uniref:tRNA lysidine(34) synthetase TilS n=1 Tax=Salinimonas chungwhensis TaxID=265425 RepID=UPI0003A956A8|nr:tRNA lysidine(34) synthetase TilS [Salinimonas chungwhensis]
MSIPSLYHQIQASLSDLLLQSPERRASCFVVGFSGGVDSTVLLHALLADKPTLPVHAVYINHGLSVNADKWQNHCHEVCRSLDIPFTAIPVSIDNSPRTSLEAQARELRYQKLIEYCHHHQGILLLGQHQDDQLETFLLQAKRGAGPKGLAGMPALTWREDILICRPLLSVSRQDIESEAHYQRLKWIEDESNQDNQFDRNFLRNSIIPALTARWPVLAKTVSRSARLCAQQQALLEEAVDEKLAGMVDEGALDIVGLQSFSHAWQQQIVRRWLESAGLALPSYKQTEQLLALTEARDDAQPILLLQGWQVRRAQGRFWLARVLSSPPREVIQVKALERCDFDWSATPPFQLNQDARVQANMPSVRCRENINGVSKPLKAWMKQWGIPAWQRSHLPVVFIDGKPVAIVRPRDVIYFTDAPAGFQVIIEK